MARGGSKKILPVIPQLIIPIKCEHFVAEIILNLTIPKVSIDTPKMIISIRFELLETKTMVYILTFTFKCIKIQ